MSPLEFTHWLAAPQTPAVAGHHRSRRPLVMGILNVTPDSFSDGGRFNSIDMAVAHAVDMGEEGADVIDVGGESTRPGAAPVPADEQRRRVQPVIEAVRHRLPQMTLSVDTTSAMVAADAIDAGAAIINDVSAGVDDPAMLALAAERRVPIILMHRPGPSETMQDQPRYEDVVSEVSAFLIERRSAAVAAGVGAGNILFDPGIGFGKTTEHDVALLRATARLAAMGQPLVIGVSRKKFIGRLTAQSSAEERLVGTAAAVAFSVANGADMVRVHDVAAMVQAVAVAAALRS